MHSPSMLPCHCHNYLATVPLMLTYCHSTLSYASLYHLYPVIFPPFLSSPLSATITTLLLFHSLSAIIHSCCPCLALLVPHSSQRHFTDFLVLMPSPSLTIALTNCRQVFSSQDQLVPPSHLPLVFPVLFSQTTTLASLTNATANDKLPFSFFSFLSFSFLSLAPSQIILPL